MAQLTRSQKARLGMFLATGIILVVGATVVLAARSLLESRDTYTIRFSNKDLSFSGLEPGSSVKYSGIKVGRVEEIHIDPDDVSVIEVGISLEGGTPVAENSTASLGSMGITGLKYIELSRGAPDARIREPGEEIPAGESLIDELSAKALSIAAQLEATLENIQKMTAAENQERLARVLESAASMIEDNAQDIRQLTANLNTAAENTTEIMARLDEFATQLVVTGDHLDELILSAKASLGEGGLKTTVDHANELLSNTNLVVRRNQTVFESTLRDLRTSAENLYDLTQNVKDNPSLLFRGPRNAGEDLVR